jgi:GTP-binding protein Era
MQHLPWLGKDEGEAETSSRNLGERLKETLGQLSDRLAAGATAREGPLPEGPDAAWAQASQVQPGARPMPADKPSGAAPVPTLPAKPAASAPPAKTGGQRRSSKPATPVPRDVTGVAGAAPAKARHAGRRGPKADVSPEPGKVPAREAPSPKPAGSAAPRNALVLIGDVVGSSRQPEPAAAKEGLPKTGKKQTPRRARAAQPGAALAPSAAVADAALPQPSPAAKTRGDAHLDLARESLRDLVQDPRIPPEVRDALAQDYAQVEAMLEKLEQGHIHVAAFGRVSVGKSATLNALLGEQRFATSPLHGETKVSQVGRWEEFNAGGIYLVDTPGLNEVEGEERERLAHEVAARSDLVLFVVDGDLTDTEIRALRVLVQMQRPILLVFNKVDRYTGEDRAAIRDSIARHTAGFIDPRNIVCISALPAERLIVTVDEQGRETQSLRQDPPDMAALRTRLWELLETEGKTLAALNASLFASDLSDQVAQRILKVKRKLGARLIRSYCIGKGVAVALNPIPVADLLAALAVDVGMVVHLSRLYGLPLSRREAGTLIKVIATQMALLMGTVWAVNLISSALKLGTGGLSTVLTGTAQGAVAYYSTYVVGQAAELYLAQGKSWGELGPKQVIRDILDGIDRNSILAQARSDIAARLRSR